MATSMDTTAAPRLAIRVPVAVELADLCGEAWLRDISSTGARLENTPLRPQPGDPVRITFALSLDSPALELSAHVVRETVAGGFAIHFTLEDTRLRAMLDAAQRHPRARVLSD